MMCHSVPVSWYLLAVSRHPFQPSHAPFLTFCFRVYAVNMYRNMTVYTVVLRAACRWAVWQAAPDLGVDVTTTTTMTTSTAATAATTATTATAATTATTATTYMTFF